MNFIYANCILTLILSHRVLWRIIVLHPIFVHKTRHGVLLLVDERANLCHEWSIMVIYKMDDLA